MADQAKLNSVWTYLADHGLNMAAVFETEKLPASLIEMMRADEVPLERFSRLVMLGNGGALFWEKLTESGWHGEDPIDHFSQFLTVEALKILDPSLTKTNYFNLYPLTKFVIPLQRLGSLAGWGEPSPIGPSISGRYGLWFAYRSAFLTNLPFSTFSTEEVHPPPCDTCEGFPCQTICPPKAVKVGESLHLKGCLTHRLSPSSTCRATCLARQACPVGKEYTYPQPVIARLYTHSLTNLRQWLE